jgi:hypothetical protein
VGVLGLDRDVDRVLLEASVRGLPVVAAFRADTVEAFARNLYRWFTELDARGATSIVAVLPGEDGLGRALRDRLLRASDDLG